MVYDLIIIGLGPAGISAGIYAKRQNLECVVIGEAFGGQMASKAVDIENYPGFEKISGFELIERMTNHLTSKGAIIIEDGVVKFSKAEFFEIETFSGKVFQSKTVIIATGAEPRKIDVEGEHKFLGKGVSYCTTCDAAFYRNKTIVIIGGGDAGFEAARFVAGFASKVYIVERGDEFLASKENQGIISSLYPKIETIKNADILSVKGNEHVEGIALFDKVSKQEKDLAVDGVFVQAGYVPASSLFKDYVDLNEKKEIIVDRDTLQTKTPGLFASGDVNNGWLKQIVVSCGEGAKAAISAYNYLKKK